MEMMVSKVLFGKMLPDAEDIKVAMKPETKDLWFDPLKYWEKDWNAKNPPTTGLWADET